MLDLHAKTYGSGSENVSLIDQKRSLELSIAARVKDLLAQKEAIEKELVALDYTPKPKRKRGPNKPKVAPLDDGSVYVPVKESE